MKWWTWAGLGIGAWWLLTREPPKTALAPMSQTMFDQLKQLAKAKYPTMTDILITPWVDGSMTFSGQGLAPDGQSIVMIKLFEAKNPDDALRRLQ